jgi:short-subunit dehydrogenase
MNVVVTGASKGIGKAIAAAFAKEGAHLLLCSRNEAQLYQAQAELQTNFPQSTVRAKAFDLSNAAAAKGFGQWCLEAGVPAVLINNAGVYLPGNIHDEPEGSLEQMMNTNLYSAYHLTRTLLPSMMAARTGHIFNICSVASLNAYPNGGGYSISKFAMMGFDKNLREELKPHGIKVTGVYPGAVLTDSWGNFDNSDGRIMETEDIAAMVLAASKLSVQAVVEDIILRPQLGDL